jgi:ABC-2 type transport system ATP-binding protein
MEDEIAIKVSGVSKTFKLPHERYGSLKSAVVNFYRRNRSFEEQTALRDINLEIRKGEFFGIVGRNGSGKSTLLKLLAGIYSPTRGLIEVNGRLTPFIELGVGFNQELTGRENVFLNGALLGFSRHAMQSMYDDIVNFAELHKFMDQKLKNYSSGMQVRLAFSIATRVQTDILIIDEVLAVGDAAFQQKCYDYFMHLKRTKQTVVLVTHDMGAVRQYCDRAIMIESSKVVESGTPDKVSQAYQKMFTLEIEKDKTTYDDAETKRWGTKKMMSTDTSAKVNADNILITSTFKASQSLPAPILGFSIFGPTGNNILEGNTERCRFKTKPMNAGDVMTIVWEIPNILKSGKYSITVAACDQPKVEFYDWLNEACSFSVKKEYDTGGIVDPVVSIDKYDLKEEHD